MAIRYLDENPAAQSPAPRKTKIRYLDSPAGEGDGSKTAQNAPGGSSGGTLGKVGRFAESANLTFLGGLGRGVAGAGKFFANDAADKKIEDFLDRVAPKADTSTAEGATGAKLGGALRTATETVPTLLLPGGGRAVRAGSSAIVGGIKALSASGEAGKSSSEQLRDALTAAVLSAGVSSGGEAAVSGVKKGLKAGAEGIYEQIIKTPKAQVVAGKERIGEGLLRRGISGSYDKMDDAVRELARSNSDELQRIIQENADAPVEVSGARRGLAALRERLAATPGENTNAVDAVLDAFPEETLPLGKAQPLKRNLQAAVNDAFLRQNTTGTTQAQKIAAQELRRSIEKAVPSVAAPNKELEFASRAGRRLTEQGNLSPSKLRLYAELAAGVYGAQQSAEQGNVSPLIQLILAERLLTNPSTASRIAQGAYKASDKTLNPALNTAIQRYLSREIGSNSGN